MRRALLATATGAGVCALLLTTGCSGPESGSSSDPGSGSSRPELSVEGAFMPAPPTDSMAAGFLTVTNDGGGADTLTSVTSDIAGSVEVHETADQKMKKVDSLAVPANGTLDLERGGSHLMFLDLEEKPEEGQRFSVELHFEESGTVRVGLPVKAATYDPKSH